jgi:hypothetical protein
MSTLAWRRLLLGLCTFALIQVGVAVWMDFAVRGEPGIAYSASGPFPVLLSPTGVSFVDRITVHRHEGAAYRAGLRTGDLIDLRPLLAADRYGWTFNHFRRGERMVLPVVRGNRIDHISIAPANAGFGWDIWLFIAGSVWALLCAALISWRRAESAEARTLVLLLIAWVFGTIFLPYCWITPWTAADAMVGVVGAVAGSLGSALLAAYAMLFARPPSLLRRALTWLSYGSAALATLYGILATIGVWALSADPVQSWYSGTLPQVLTAILPMLFPLLCVLVTLGQARGAERARMAWASGSVGVMFLAQIATGTIAAFDITDPHLLNLIAYLNNLSVFLAPLGLTYALLSRRLLDVSFVINRAAVFSGVSIIVVGIFMLGEWVLGTWFSKASHMTNLEVSAALAIGLGFSVRTIHARVDRVLDQMFFRKRHEDEAAIRAFADEAAEVTDDVTLLRGTRETLETHADASFVTLAMDDGAGQYGDVSASDPAIVALRDRHKVLDLQTLSTELRGEFAYPMIARGQLVGALVLGPKRSGESYAPDESHAIRHLARNVGGAFHILSLAKVLQEHHLQA